MLIVTIVVLLLGGVKSGCSSSVTSMIQLVIPASRANERSDLKVSVVRGPGGGADLGFRESAFSFGAAVERFG
jgi:hypothetical protein